MECEITKPQECPAQPKPESGIWIISYLSREVKTYRGIAIVRAVDAHDAECTFRAQSQHNGHNKDLKITKLYQVGDSYESMLLAEEYFVVEEV